MYFLGLDLGTTALKAIIVDEHQRVLAEAIVPLATRNPRPGWSEQNPEDWWQALADAMRQLGGAAPAALRGVRAIGLSGQMHGAVLVDRAGAAIRPAILWNDGRAARQSAALNEVIGDLATIAGVPAMPGFTAPKLLWIAEHEPENRARLWKVLSPKDYIRLRLTGEAVTDMSDAAGTLWLDERRRDWCDPILQACRIGRQHVPALAEGSDPTGVLRPSLVDAWGMDAAALVAGGAGDAAAAGIGIGAVENGDAFISLGTSGQLFVTDDDYRPSAGAFLHAFAHALPQRWFRMAAMLNGASCLGWAARLVGADDIPILLDRVESAYRGPSYVLFLPYLAGERTPHNDPDARGVFFGLDAATDAAALVQATLEGVALSFLDGKRAMDAAGIPLRSVAAVGGGARSRFWMQLFAHVLGIPVVRYKSAEIGPAFGAARLARIALTRERVAEVCVKPEVMETLLPDAALHAAYVERLDAYRRLYRALKQQFSHAAAMRPGFSAVD